MTSWNCQPPLIADLPPRFGVERGTIENDLAGVAGLELLHALSVLDNGQHLAIVRTCLTIALELGFRKLLVSGVGGLLGRSFPGGTSTGLFFGSSSFKAFKIKVNALISCRVRHEVQRKAIGFVQTESQTSRKLPLSPSLENHLNKFQNFVMTWRFPGRTRY